MLLNFPSSIKAGITLNVTIALADYPAPLWSLKALIRGPSTIDLLSVASGTSHVLAASATITSGFVAGDYRVSLRAVSGDEVVELECGAVAILDDVAGITDGDDVRGAAARGLAAIDAVLLGRASKDQESYTINGRSLTRTSIADLLLLQKSYQTAVAKEKRGGKSRRFLGRKINIGFGT